MTARPSYIKAEYQVPLARPRSAMDIRYDPHFVDLQKLIWNDLKDEVIESRGGEDYECIEP